MSMRRDRPREGFTLIELLIVVMVLGVIALLAVPNLAPQRNLQLDAAAEEAATALRFARAEAMRTETPHGVRVNSAKEELSVFVLDTATDPPTERFTVRHPLDKSVYTIELDGSRSTEGSSISASFSFADDEASVPATAFDRRGEPMKGESGERLVWGAITLSRDGGYRSVAVDPMTGRIEIGETSPLVPVPPTF